MKIPKVMAAILCTSTFLSLLTSCYGESDDNKADLALLNKAPIVEVEVVTESDEGILKDKAVRKKEFDPEDYVNMSSIDVAQGFGQIYLQAQARRSSKEGLSKADRLDLLELFMYRHALELPGKLDLEKSEELVKKAVAIRNGLVEKDIPTKVSVSVAPGDMYERVIKQNRLIFSSDKHELLPYNKEKGGFEYVPPSQFSCYSPTDTSPVFVPILTQPGVINMDGLLGLEIEPYSLFRGAQDCLFKPVEGIDIKEVNAAVIRGKTAILGEVYFDVDGVTYNTVGLKPIHRKLALHLVNADGSLSKPVATDEYTYKPVTPEDDADRSKKST